MRDDAFKKVREEYKRYDGKQGQFIKWGEDPSELYQIGVFSSLCIDTYSRKFWACSLTDGFPEYVTLSFDTPHEFITQKEGLISVGCIEANLLERMEDGLLGALAARKLYQLSNIESKLRRSQKASDNLTAIKNSQEEPGTGVYLILPYCRDSEDNLKLDTQKMEAIRVVPRIAESSATDLVKWILKNQLKFGKITNDYHSGCIKAYEVPNKGLQFVHNPKTLEWSLS